MGIKYKKKFELSLKVRSLKLKLYRWQIRSCLIRNYKRREIKRREIKRKQYKRKHFLLVSWCQLTSKNQHFLIPNNILNHLLTSHHYLVYNYQKVKFQERIEHSFRRINRFLESLRGRIFQGL